MARPKTSDELPECASLKLWLGGAFVRRVETSGGSGERPVDAPAIPMLG
jgi:hypothetical protein